MNTPEQQLVDWILDLESDLRVTLKQLKTAEPEARPDLLAYERTLREQLSDPKRSLEEALRS